MTPEKHRAITDETKLRLTEMLFSLGGLSPTRDHQGPHPCRMERWVGIHRSGQKEGALMCTRQALCDDIVCLKNQIERLRWFEKEFDPIHADSLRCDYCDGWYTEAHKPDCEYIKHRRPV